MAISANDKRFARAKAEKATSKVTTTVKPTRNFKPTSPTITQISISSTIPQGSEAYIPYPLKITDTIKAEYNTKGKYQKCRLQGYISKNYNITFYFLKFENVATKIVIKTLELIEDSNSEIRIGFVSKSKTLLTSPLRTPKAPSLIIPQLKINRKVNDYKAKILVDIEAEVNIISTNFIYNYNLIGKPIEIIFINFSD